MGSCISKCKPKTKIKMPHQDCTMMISSHVQDKLVIISQPPLIMSPKLALCPTPSSSSSSFSNNSFISCASKNNSSELTSSSSSSCSSSIMCSKDRSFSNDFLRSCAKENPQIIGFDSIKDRLHARKLDVCTKPNVAPVKQSNIPENRLVKSTTQKRARLDHSPTLTRQKSFRVEPGRMNSTYSRNLRSPSPSRRFNGENCGHKGTLISTYSTKESCGRKRSVNSARKENVRPASPSNRLSRDQYSFLRNGERFCHQIESKVDEFGFEEVRSDVLMDITMDDDIDNPLIALDCFIFL